MADNQDVSIEIGAKIDKLIEGVNQANDKIKSISSATDSLAGGFGRLGDMIVAAFSISAISAFVDKMGELGLQTERVMAQLGMSAAEVGTLSGLAKVTGTSMEGLALSIERLSLNVQRSTKDAFSPQAEALSVLGLRAHDLIGIPTAEYFEKLHNAVSQFNPSLNLTNAVMAVGGRGIAQIIPLLQLSGEKWKEMKDRILEAKEGLDKAIPGMADTHVQTALLSMSTESLSATIFSRLKPAIDGIIHSFDDFVKFTKAAIKEGGSLENTFAFITISVRLAASATAAMTSGVIALGVALEGLAKLAAGDVEEFEKTAEKTAAAMEKIGRDLKARLDEIWSTPVPITVHPNDRNDARAIEQNGRQALEAAKALAEQQVKNQEQMLARIKIIYDADAANFKTSESVKFARLMQSTKDAEAEEIKIYQSVLAMHGLSLKERQEFENKIVQLKQKTATTIAQLDAQQFAAERAVIGGYIGTIESSWSSGLRGMLSGTMTFAQAMKKIFGDIVIYAIEQFMKKYVFEQAITALTEALHIKSEATKAAATIASTEATLPVRAAKFTSDITADSALVFGGIFANLAALMGPLAAGPAAAGQATVLAQLPAIPKFELGTDYVPSTGLAIVHQGERIIPASQNMAGAGGGTTEVHIHAVDARSVTNLLMSNKNIIGDIIHRLHRDNPAAFGKYAGA